jgi:hypothetical protein
MMPRTSLCALALAAVLAAAPAPAFAQAADAPAAKLDPAAEAAARELFNASDIRNTMRDSNQKTLAQMRSGAALSAMIDQNPQVKMKRATNPQAWDAALARLGTKQAAIMEKVLADLQPEVEERTVQLYARTFSVADLKGITAFYHSPLGRRMIAQMPAVMSDTMSWVQSELPKRVGPAMAEFQPEVQRELAPLMSTPK